MTAAEKKEPILRFKEFEGQVEYQALDGHINLVSGYAFKGDDISENPSGISILRGINITTGRIRHSVDIDRYYIGELNYDKFKVISGDLVLPMDGSKVGKNVALVGEEDSGAILIQRVARIRAKKTSDTQYIYHLIRSIKFQRYVDKVNTSSGIPHISSKQIKDFKIPFPTLPEQQKIANFLTAVDTKLEQLACKKTLLEQYKKGIMQQIFSQELRFTRENGSSYSDWEEKKLGEVCIFNPKSEDLPNEFIYIDLESVVAKKLVKENTIYKNDAPSRAQRLLKSGDILYQTVRPYQMNNLHFNLKGKYVASTGYAQIRTRQNASFIFQLLHSSDFVKKVILRCTGTSYPAISSNDLKKIKIGLPSLEEQTQIANFLSAIDAKIALVDTQIDGTMNFKKGLLQQMFV